MLDNRRKAFIFTVPCRLLNMNIDARRDEHHSPHIDVAQVNPRSLSVTARHVMAETAHFEQFC